MTKVRGVNRNSKETEHDKAIHGGTSPICKISPTIFSYILFVISKNLNNEININKRRIKMKELTKREEVLFKKREEEWAKRRKVLLNAIFQKLEYYPNSDLEKLVKDLYHSDRQVNDLTGLENIH